MAAMVTVRLWDGIVPFGDGPANRAGSPSVVRPTVPGLPAWPEPHTYLHLSKYRETTLGQP
jgi:hypothetical protein